MDKTVAFVTCQEKPEITVDDALAIEALGQHDIEVVGIPWQQANVDWSRFDAVILRSTWDYFHNISAFLRWLRKLRELGVNLVNPYEILHWNAEKTYLKDLERAGVAIVPTVIVPMQSKILITDLLKEKKLAAGGNQAYGFGNLDAYMGDLA